MSIYLKLACLYEWLPLLRGAHNWPEYFGLAKSLSGLSPIFYIPWIFTQPYINTLPCLHSIQLSEPLPHSHFKRARHLSTLNVHFRIVPKNEHILTLNMLSALPSCNSLPWSHLIPSTQSSRLHPSHVSHPPTLVLHHIPAPRPASYLFTTSPSPRELTLFFFPRAYLSTSKQEPSTS